MTEIYENLVTEKQLRKMAKVFRITKRTFQETAREAGLTNIPDHANEISKEQARKFLRYYGAFFVKGKEKQ